MITHKQAKIVRERAENQCEAMVSINGGVWARCWKSPVEIHHMLTRARGGSILDNAGEVYHLIALCPACHRMSDGEIAYAGELLIDGYVTTDNEGRPVYNGSDPYLRRKYGNQRSQ